MRTKCMRELGIEILCSVLPSFLAQVQPSWRLPPTGRDCRITRKETSFTEMGAFGVPESMRIGITSLVRLPPQSGRKFLTVTPSIEKIGKSVLPDPSGESTGLPPTVKCSTWNPRRKVTPSKSFWIKGMSRLRNSCRLRLKGSSSTLPMLFLGLKPKVLRVVMVSFLLTLTLKNFISLHLKMVAM